MKIEVSITQSIFNAIAEDMSIDDALMMLFNAYGVQDNDAATVTVYTLDMLNELERID